MVEEPITGVKIDDFRRADLLGIMVFILGLVGLFFFFFGLFITELVYLNIMEEGGDNLTNSSFFDGIVYMIFGPLLLIAGYMVLLRSLSKKK